MDQDDARWMRLALSLGARGAGQVWPNPAVGCVTRIRAWMAAALTGCARAAWR